jgi:long-chain acyl-CoA synthetase
MSATGKHNLARLAEESFERRGDYPALLFDGRWHSSAELFERSRRLAAGLAELGVGPGDRVVVTMANCPEVGIAYQALWRAGVVVTPAMFLLPQEALRHVIEDAQATAVITSPEFTDKVRDAVDGIESVRFVISSGDAGGEVISLEALERAEPGPIVSRADDQLAALLYTGGTTGRAKGVMLTHSNLHFTGRAGCDAGHVPGVTRSLATLPLSHAYGLLITIVGMHVPEPGVAVLLRWFEPDTFLELIEQHRLEQSAVVPSMLQLLLSKPLEDYDLSSLRYLSCGAAPLSREVEAEFIRRAPSVSIRQGYGLTETAALVATNPVGREKSGSVGLPVPGTSVRILDEQDDDLPAGGVGEICVRSPGVMRGYWRAPEATSEALSDGWLRTGDVGYLDDDGYLFIVDRKKDLIIRGGFNVYPRDVEDTLLEHPAVSTACVVGKLDEIHGEEVVAFVSLRPDAAVTADELVDWSREHIGGYKYPRELHIVESIPLTAIGKVDRKAVRALVRETEHDLLGS